MILYPLRARRERSEVAAHFSYTFCFKLFPFQFELVRKLEKKFSCLLSRKKWIVTSLRLGKIICRNDGCVMRDALRISQSFSKRLPG
jgi:hypothetical protein